MEHNAKSRFVSVLKKKTKNEKMTADAVTAQGLYYRASEFELRSLDKYI